MPYLLRLRDDIPLVGSELTLAFVEAKLKEHRIRPVLRQVIEHEEVSYGPFDLEFVSVTHSIPDALAVFVRTEAGKVLITGDFKMDQLPLDRRLTDLRASLAWARKVSTYSWWTPRTLWCPASSRPSVRLAGP